MNIEISTQYDPATAAIWSEFINKNKLPPLCLPQWGLVASTVYDRKFVLLTARDAQGLIQGFCCGYYNKEVFFSLPYGFFAQDQDIAEKIMRSIESFAEREKLYRAVITSLQSFSFEEDKKSSVRKIMILPLGFSEEDALWDSIPKKQRNMIKKAESHGYNHHKDWKFFEEFYQIYLNHCHERKLVIKSKNYFDALKKSFGENLVLYTVARNNQPEAGMIFLKNNHMACYLYNAGTEEAQKAGVNNYLMWNASRDFFKQGLSCIELGPSADGSPVYNFKKRLGKHMDELPLYKYEFFIQDQPLHKNFIQFIKNKYKGILSRTHRYIPWLVPYSAIARYDSESQVF